MANSNHPLQTMLGILLYLLPLALMLPATLNASELPRAPVDEDYYYNSQVSPAMLELGQKLFFDKLISGNRNIACATCHHPQLATSDGLQLSIGEGAHGIGEKRDTGRFPHEIGTRIGRNAQSLFNVGAKEYLRMFHDGRVEVSPFNSEVLLSPAGDELPQGLDNVLAAQAMFPVLSADEMAGQDGENPIAVAVADHGLSKAWELIAARLRQEQGYVDLFLKAFPEIRQSGNISFVHAANALAAFQTVAWRSDNSPFDQYLRGDLDVLTAQQKHGLELFYGKADCAHCHSGPFLTDHAFHSIAVPQVGPGKGSGFDGHEDFGREMISGHTADRYKFRTPSLRNVELTGPWSHDGAFSTLDSVVRHHLNPQRMLASINLERPLNPHRADLAALDFLVQDDPSRRMHIASYSELGEIQLEQTEINALVAFLHALTDPASRKLNHTLPESVPSGLSIDR